VGYRAQVPPEAARFFGQGAPHPIVNEVFVPGRGWKRGPHVLPNGLSLGRVQHISRSLARKLRAAGVTGVNLRSGIRQADFDIKELTR
jgi:hypothetical protein